MLAVPARIEVFSYYNNTSSKGLVLQEAITPCTTEFFEYYKVDVKTQEGDRGKF